jgi:hypothetical protein
VVLFSHAFTTDLFTMSPDSTPYERETLVEHGRLGVGVHATWDINTGNTWEPEDHVSGEEWVTEEDVTATQTYGYLAHDIQEIYSNNVTLKSVISVFHP